MADRNDIEIANNSAWAGTFTLRGADGQPRNITGATFEMDIRRKADDADPPIATLTTANGRAALSATPTDGRVNILIPLAIAQAILPGLYEHDMIMTIGGITERVWYGSLRVVQGVSR